MIFLGNGDASSAQCWSLVQRLVNLLTELGGLQQPGDDTPLEEQRLRAGWDEKAEELARDVAMDLGVAPAVNQLFRYQKEFDELEAALKGMEIEVATFGLAKAAVAYIKSLEEAIVKAEAVVVSE